MLSFIKIGNGTLRFAFKTLKRSFPVADII